MCKEKGGLFVIIYRWRLLVRNIRMFPSLNLGRECSLPKKEKLNGCKTIVYLF